jgi:hypothetical protein
VPSQQWRAPVAARVKPVLTGAAGVTIALVFFPLWFAIPIAVVCGAWGLGIAAFGASVAVDENAGLLVLRLGLLIRRIRLADINTVLVDQTKISIGRAHGAEISLYAWRRGPLDALLGVPAVAGDIGHAISTAAAMALVPADSQATPGERPPASGRPTSGGMASGGTASGRPASGGTASGPTLSGRTPERIRSRLATGLLAGAGVLAIVGALVVRVHWHSPVLTVLGVIIAVGLGVSGLLYLLSALLILLTGRMPLTGQAPRITLNL